MKIEVTKREKELILNAIIFYSYAVRTYSPLKKILEKLLYRLWYRGK